MDAKAQELVLLAALSLFCAGFAWILGHLVLGSVLFALGVVAIGAATVTWRALTPPAGLGLLNVASRRELLHGRAARGSADPRKMACRPLAGKGRFTRLKAIDSR
jgi:hypothetical protein